MGKRAWSIPHCERFPDAETLIGSSIAYYGGTVPESLQEILSKRRQQVLRHDRDGVVSWDALPRRTTDAMQVHLMKHPPQVRVNRRASRRRAPLTAGVMSTYFGSDRLKLCSCGYQVGLSWLASFISCATRKDWLYVLSYEFKVLTLMWVKVSPAALVAPVRTLITSCPC